MPKGWLYDDKRESDSERRAKPQRHIVKELAYCLSVVVVVVVVVSMTEAKGHRPGP